MFPKYLNTSCHAKLQYGRTYFRFWAYVFCKSTYHPRLVSQDRFMFQTHFFFQCTRLLFYRQIKNKRFLCLPLFVLTLQTSFKVNQSSFFSHLLGGGNPAKNPNKLNSQQQESVKISSKNIWFKKVHACFF